MKKYFRFALFLIVFVPYIAIVGGADLVRTLWREA